MGEREAIGLGEEFIGSIVGIQGTELVSEQAHDDAFSIAGALGGSIEDVVLTSKERME
jgi:hypothetical protein